MPSLRNQVIVAALWLTMLVVVSVARVAGTRSARPAAFSTSVIEGGQVIVEAPRHHRQLRPEATNDLMGNPVEKAVMDYRVDGGGDTYETHSPGTALTELVAPGT